MSDRTVTVRTGGRLHFGFRNLATERERIFGSIGVALADPGVSVTAAAASDIHCDHDRASEFASRSVSLLGVNGATVTVDEELPRHVGLGSGTQLALATHQAIAVAHDVDSQLRDHAPALGRGRRSGVGIATFERGGLVVDDGHPTEEVIGPPRDREDWTPPSVVTREPVPEAWRFVLVNPDVPPGKHGREERESIRSAIRTASEETSAEIERILHRRLLPAVQNHDPEKFGAGIHRIDALNGSWFEPEEGIPAGELVERLNDSDAISGAGQSSWGALVYGLTNTRQATAAEVAGHDALAELGISGSVTVASARNHGATIADSDRGKRRMYPSANGGTK